VRSVRYVAAGGVLTDGDRVLVLHRPSLAEVRLPKGHVDPGETPREAAVREVAEEGGYADLEIVAELGEQLVRFPSRRARAVVIERMEHYFLMRLLSQRTAPRPWEDLQFDPFWVPWEEAEQALTFGPEQEWLRRARDIWRARPPEG